jgi:DNA anti-recombination protein RmuC
MTVANLSTPTPIIHLESRVQRLNTFLDKHVLPYPVKYLTNRVTILATLCMLAPLIIFADVTVFVLATNSYLNVMSVVVSSTVLLYSTLSEARDRAAADRREQIAAQHEKMVEQRAEDDHARIQQINDHLDQIHSEVIAHINTSLANIQNILITRMEKMQEEDHTQITETHQAVITEVAAHAQELADMKAMLNALHIDSNGSDSKPSAS